MSFGLLSKKSQRSCKKPKITNLASKKSNWQLWCTHEVLCRPLPYLACQKQFLSSDGEGVINFLACFSMKTTSWARAFRAKLICVVSACTRAIYFPACFGQRLLAWRTCSPACTNSFCPNWSRLPHEGPPRRNFVTPQVNMLILGKLSFPIKN